MTKSQLMQAAHRMANQIVFDDYKTSYRVAMSQALKNIYYSLNLIKNAKKELSASELELILSSGGSLQVNTFKNNEFINQDLVNTLEKYSYKSWAYPGGHQFFFSNELINALI